MIEKAISKLLKIGVALSSFWLIIGAVLLFFNNNEPENFLSNTYFHDLTLGSFLDDILSLKSNAFLFLGTLTLLLTPVARIVLSLILFIKTKNTSFIIICSISLIVILLCILVKLLF